MSHDRRPAMRLRPLLNGFAQDEEPPPEMASDVWVGDQVLIGGGTTIGDGAILDHQVIVESDVQFGRRSLACYRAQICAGAIIGDGCVVGGFIGERSQLGDNCRVFGALVHRHPRECGGWDDEDAMVEGPILGVGVFVAFGAVVVGNIKIGDGAYIGANAVVTKDVPPGRTIGPAQVWGGRR
jgi:acetyltransferase-like isoleucine patch superfamily enzyme